MYFQKLKKAFDHALKPVYIIGLTMLETSWFTLNLFEYEYYGNTLTYHNNIHREVAADSVWGRNRDGVAHHGFEWLLSAHFFSDCDGVSCCNDFAWGNIFPRIVSFSWVAVSSYSHSLSNEDVSSIGIYLTIKLHRDCMWPVWKQTVKGIDYLDISEHSSI